MCEDCSESPVRYVAYHNKAGGKLWRPGQKIAPRRSAIDVASTEAAAKSREFACLEVPSATTAVAPSFVCDGALLDNESLPARPIPQGIA